VFHDSPIRIVTANGCFDLEPIRQLYEEPNSDG
jgi:hypothetical protein